MTTPDPASIPLGATLAGDTCRFLVWAPQVRRVDLVFEGNRRHPMQPLVRGYHYAEVRGLSPGDRYAFSLDNSDPLPDPASRWQPDGPHKFSAIAAPDFAWSAKNWTNPPLDHYVIYELHIGAFTPEGTFDSAAARLPELAALGVTAVEVMPIAQFSVDAHGGRNWGYDGVGLFAAQSTYGGPAAFHRFVDAAHAAGLAVILDVVYNHIGPEGNYLPRFGPYFTDRYKSPWGPGLNFEDAEVRRYFIENALYWTRDCRVDALRLDAVHAINDPSPRHLISELCAAVHAVPPVVPPVGGFATTGAPCHYCIAESADNDPRLTTPAADGGLGADAQWNDDFHHALRTLLTGEKNGYYKDYGALAHLERAFTRGFVRTTEFTPAHPAAIPARRLVVFSQNHDHTGNRPLGERLNSLVTPAQSRLAAAAIILSPFIPLLFMGEEYAETAPFLFFCSHTDRALIEAVRRGRAAELAGLAFPPGLEAPDPQSETTFVRSRLSHVLKAQPAHAQRLAYYKELLRLRRENPALARVTTEGMTVARDDDAHTLLLRRPSGSPGEEGDVIIAMCFGESAAVALPLGPWRSILSSEEKQWGGNSALPVITAGNATLPAWSATIFTRGHA